MIETLAEQNVLDNLWTAIGWGLAMVELGVIAALYLRTKSLRKDVADAVASAKALSKKS